jgi:hypothetical protein
MYNFVKTDVHPRLADLTAEYERLSTANERAVIAVRNSSSAGSALRDLIEPEPRSGRERDIEARTAAHTSAMLEECAAFRALYEALSATQKLIAKDHYVKAYNEIVEAPDAEWWWLTTYEHNIMCISELLKDAIDTGARFKNDQLKGKVGKSTQNTMLPDRHAVQLQRFLGCWLRWAASVPWLSALDDPSADRIGNEFLLLRLLSQTAATEREMTVEGDFWLTTKAVLERLRRYGWQACEQIKPAALYAHGIIVRRPKDTVAPVMPVETSGAGARKSFK